MSRKIANTPIDPTLPKTPVVIDGKTYDLCFDLGALAEAEREFNAQGVAVNLLMVLPVLNLASVRDIFPCAVHKFHPEISYGEAQKLVTLATLYPIARTIKAAWDDAMPKPEPKTEKQADPPAA